MDFEAYLISKKIDGVQFAKAEPQTWNAWKIEFEQIHPNSFTAQKLYLINPVRRKYPLKIEVVIEAKKPEVASEVKVEKAPAPTTSDTSPAPAKPLVPRPVFKPKPKMS